MLNEAQSLVVTVIICSGGKRRQGCALEALFGTQQNQLPVRQTSAQ